MVRQHERRLGFFEHDTGARMIVKQGIHSGSKRLIFSTGVAQVTFAFASFLEFECVLENLVVVVGLHPGARAFRTGFVLSNGRAIPWLRPTFFRRFVLQRPALGRLPGW